MRLVAFGLEQFRRPHSDDHTVLRLHCATVSQRTIFWMLNVAGGVAVLGSYFWGFLTH